MVVSGQTEPPLMPWCQTPSFQSLGAEGKVMAQAEAGQLPAALHRETGTLFLILCLLLFKKILH